MNPEPSFSSGPTGCEVAGAGQAGLRGGALRHRLAAEASDLPDGADQHQLDPCRRQAHQPRYQDQVLRDRLPGVPQPNAVLEPPTSDEVPAPNPDRPSGGAYRALQASRELQGTAAFAVLYGRRAGIEGTISQAVRACGVCRSRYIGRQKTHLGHVLTAVTINLQRIDAWLTDTPRSKTRHSSFARLMAAAT